MPKTFTEVETPFTNMSFTPDVPASALGANEYNSGYNVETDTRGIKSVLGDEEILSQLSGTPIYITGNYRHNDVWWFVVATNAGKWYAVNSTSVVNVTPGYAADPNAFLPGYYDGMPITDTWNGNVLFINDSVNAPMFLLDNTTEFEQYSQVSTVLDVTNAVGTGSTVTLTFPTQASAPFEIGNSITVAGVDPTGYNGTFVVTNCTSNTVSYLNNTTSAFVSGGTIVPLYQWNYNPNWKSVAAGFMHMYSTPNVGSILIAGNLTVVDQANTQINYPVTVQWSQAFGLNSGPLTWAPTVTNIANQLEVPLRGPALDGFPMGGNFYICSYWDTVIFSPINYQNTSAPVLGVRLLTQGRGLLNENCWANADTLVYGLDARDFWSFDGSNFKGIGNQRIKEYFFNNLNPDYTNRVFVINNTQKYQIEYYYPDLTSTGWCNKMLSYRYDLDVWNPPRDIDNASMATESPIFTETGNVWSYNNGSRCVVYTRGVEDSKIVQKDQGFTFLGDPISSQFRRDNIQLCPTYSQQALLHRVYPEIVTASGDPTGNIIVNVGGSNSTGQPATLLGNVSMAIDTDTPWTQFSQNAFRLNTIEVQNVSSVSQWQLNSVNWQFTPTQDSR